MSNEQPSIQNILANVGIDALNEMQVASMEAVGQDKDIILLSSTGTGKTIAFLLPLYQIMDGALKHTQAMIIVPSRELALQIEQVFKKMGTGLKVTCCYGGQP